MCGIAGFINFNGHDQDIAGAELKRMTDAIAHRGPDAEGFYIDKFAALGHRRLSIIDLSGGHQPMATNDGNLQIIFNGEIYNYLELKHALEIKGYLFSTNSDTETILYAYKEWKESCLEKLNGMFAFAIWDKKNRTLFLARDRVGKKPLYYYWDGVCFSFSSELKAMRAADKCPKALDYKALDCYLSFGYIPAPMTIYKDVRKLPSASYMIVKNSGISVNRYWQLQFSQPSEYTEHELLEQFEELFDAAVNSRLMSEVPLGAFLSGGLDSTLVVSSMTKVSNNKVSTNSIGFGDREFNELPLAAKVAQHLRTRHKEYIVNPNITNVLEKIAYYFDEPFADSSAIPTWYVCKMARENVTVALSGDGGDENFGGYTFRYIPHVQESRLRSLIPRPIRNLLGFIGKFYPSSSRLPKPFRLKTILENLALSDSRAFYNDLVWLRSDLREKIYSRSFFNELQGFHPYEIVKPLYENPYSHDPLSRALYTDIHLYMVDNCLVKVDRMSMAHALEVRSPFLDYKLVEFAATLPNNLKIRNGKGKIILRQLAAQRLPAQILRQPKRGFSIPAARWLRHELKSMTEKAILGEDAFPLEFLNKKHLQKTWQEHLSGHRDHSVFIWGLIMLDLWAKKHLGWR